MHDYSSWENITSRVTQGSILGPFFLSNNYDILSYEDNDTPCVMGETIESIIESQEKVSVTIFLWFSDSKMEGNGYSVMRLVSCLNKY